VELPEVDVLDEGDVILGMPVAAVADLVIEIIDLFSFVTDTQCDQKLMKILPNF
jgi:hypothetical protein